MGASLRELIKTDLVAMLDDTISYLGESKNVKVFESLDDPGIANSGGVLSYFIGNSSDFKGIARNQKFVFDENQYTIISFRVNLYGGISVTFNKA